MRNNAALLYGTHIDIILFTFCYLLKYYIIILKVNITVRGKTAGRRIYIAQRM